MKKILTLAFFICLMAQAFAQTDGITYQAVIIAPEDLELPGVDSPGNFLPNTTIAIRFTIYDSGNLLEFQEVQITTTDEFGRINLLIGDGNHDYFKEMNWDGTPKDLKVEIDFEAGSNFEEMSRERLTFLPYAFHRNITATGTLTVDDRSYLNGELVVQGPTTLESTLDVVNENATNLTGTLTVEGETNLNNALNVNNNNPSNLSGSLSVNGYTALDGTLDVIGLTTLNDLTVNGEASFGDLTAEALVVNQSTNLLGTTVVDGQGVQVRITSNLPNTSTEMGNHPLLIDGGNNGLAIKVNGERSPSNNYISFWDNDQMWGRIEGQREQDLENNYIYNFKKSRAELLYARSLTGTTVSLIEATFSTAEVAGALSSSTGCVGLGSCITLPIPSFIANKGVKTVLKFAKFVTLGLDVAIAANSIVQLLDVEEEHIGVSYLSGAGDYAEYLSKENNADDFIPGELVGIKNGLVSKDIWGSEKVMVVSTRPIVLGNMPQPDNEANSVKIAFMGQVPVRVMGKVEPGDYIIPHLISDGLARAVNPKNMETRDYKRVAGVAWNVISEIGGINTVNVAVGINTNDLSDVVYKQEQELNTLREKANLLQAEMKKSNSVLAQLVPGYAEAIGLDGEDLHKSEENNIASHKEDSHSENNYENIIGDEAFGSEDIIYFEFSREQIEAAFTMAREIYVQALEDQNFTAQLVKSSGANKELAEVLKDMPLISMEKHPFWSRIDNDPAYKEEVMQFLNSKISKAYHTHKKHEHNFKDFKIKRD